MRSGRAQAWGLVLSVAFGLLSLHTLAAGSRRDAAADRAAPDPATDATSTPAHKGTPRTKLRVGYAGSPPFALPGDGADGLSIDVWHAVADRAGIPYTLTRAQSIPELLESVAAGRFDVAVGPISITSERASHFRFTQPYFQSELGILSRERSSLWGRIRPFVTTVFAGGSVALLVLLLGVGTALWLLERRRNPDMFHPTPLHGIANGVWFALVTMTTVGYGDRVPITAGGRVITGLWMLIALVTTTSLTAGLASAFTILQLDSAAVEDVHALNGERTAVVAGTTSERFARENHARVIATPDLRSAIAKVEGGKALAVIHDKPMLQHYLAKHPDVELTLAQASYDPQGYGFIVGVDPETTSALNVALLAAKEDGQLERIAESWLGSSGK